MSQNVTFSANQIKLINWLALPKAERKPPTQEALADELGVRRETVSRWKSDDALMAAVAEKSRKLLGGDLNEIYYALRMAAKAGSYQHIKLALELTGEYIERREIEIVQKELDKTLDLLEHQLPKEDFDRVLDLLANAGG